VFLPNTATPAAMQVAESVRLAVEASMPDIGDRTLKITASIGVASSTGTVQSMTLIQKQADQAMYVAKTNGRNRVSLISQAYEEIP
jgi:diguanylate cyclase (GGDEF)-like protein